MSVAKFVFSKVAKVLASKSIYLSKSLTYRNEPHKLNVNFDHIRMSTLELCFDEIIRNNVNGNVAEIGVYKGDFAKRLNYLFSDRSLYLFDTFSGFDSKDSNKETSSGYSTADQNFSDTSVDMVLSKMPNLKKCIIKKGYFPDTAIDINDTFCFVSIDADLYNPILEGLKYFYPRLEKGGYIFIHDFNNDEYKGAKDAVLEYCKQNNISYVPISDSGGTVVINKSL